MLVETYERELDAQIELKLKELSALGSIPLAEATQEDLWQYQGLLEEITDLMEALVDIIKEKPRRGL